MIQRIKLVFRSIGYSFGLIIKDWPQGFDSILGRYYADNGKNLSGG